MSDKNKKTPSKNQGQKSGNSSNGSRKTKNHSVGENLSAQEKIRKAHELRPKVDTKPKK